MRFAIVTTQPPGSPAGPAQSQSPLAAFATALGELTPSSSKTRVGGPHHWFIDLGQDTDLFAAIIDTAKKHGVPHEVLFLGEEPVRYSYAPPT